MQNASSGNAVNTIQEMEFIILVCRLALRRIGDIVSMNGVPNVTIIPSAPVAVIWGRASTTTFPP
jgi:hypothetical protein